MLVYQASPSLTFQKEREMGWLDILCECQLWHTSAFKYYSLISTP